MKRSKQPQLIVALDVDTFEEARNLIDALSGTVDIFKVGSQLFTACGPVVVRHVLAQDKKVFLDLKYHDIPNTVGNAVGAAVGLSEAVHEVAVKEENQPLNRSKDGIFMCTVHIAGGREMLVQAVAAATKRSAALGVTKPLVVGITVLTSEEKRDNIQDLVLERSALAKDSGLDGVVVSSQEASFIRERFGEEFVIVTPGIRPQGTEAGDQKRVTAPAEAIANGSDFLVVGRPIIRAARPLEAAKRILSEMDQALRKH